MERCDWFLDGRYCTVLCWTILCWTILDDTVLFYPTVYDSRYRTAVIRYGTVLHVTYW